MKHCYRKINFKKRSLALIQQVNEICEEYDELGFDLTLRQLYYQLVSKNVIKNCKQSYDNLGELVSNARLAGLVDWDHIVDRVRNLQSSPNWNHVVDVLNSAKHSFHTNWWENQPHYVELWVEKEALLGVVARAAEEFDIPYFTCKGYNSQSEMYSASQRFQRKKKDKQEPIIYYCGDHDPSGLDMDRDIQDRLHILGVNVDVIRIALHLEQIEELGLPENFAKQTDCRFKNYQLEWGTDKSWELDAIPPNMLVSMITTEVSKVIDFDAFQEAKDAELKGKEFLGGLVSRYDDVVRFLGETA